jgi:hypothetical protein
MAATTNFFTVTVSSMGGATNAQLTPGSDGHGMECGIRTYFPGGNAI